jgi:uncharacterized protein
MMGIILKTFTTPGGSYVYDRESNSLLSVSGEEYAACQRLEAGKATGDDWELLKRYTQQGYFKETQLKEIKHPYTYYMEYQLESRVSQLTLQLTTDCTLRCSYCTYSGRYENQRTHSKKVMPLDVIKRSVDFLMAHSREVEKPTLGFYGGEPLLEIESIKACIAYINEEYPGRSMHYTLTTNGTLFTEDMCRFLEENEFSIAVSFDGPAELHDRNRVFPDGSGSFDTIIANMIYIKDNFPKLFNKVSFLAVVAPGVDLGCVNEYFSALDVLKDSQISQTTVNSANEKESVPYDDLYSITCNYQTMKILLAALNLYSEDKTSKLFTASFGLIKSLYDHITVGFLFTENMHPGGPCLPGVMRPFANTEGVLYPCERCGENSEVMKIGHIDTGFDPDKVDTLLNVGKLTEECKGCWNFIHCALCAVTADGGTGLCRDKRLNNCAMATNDTLEKLKTVCLLLENGYDFGKRV